MIRRKMVHLTLARGEWHLIAQELGRLAETAERCGPAIDTLEARILESDGYPDELLTIAQPPLNWSPLVFALSLHVLHAPTLLPIAEHLRNQMEMRMKQIEGTVRVKDPAELRRWEEATLNRCHRIATVN